MRKKSEPPRFPLTVTERKCVHCGAADTVVLERCPICRQEFCADCAFRMRGRRFCSSPCANTFMYGDEDESEDFGDL